MNRRSSLALVLVLVTGLLQNARVAHARDELNDYVVLSTGVDRYRSQYVSDLQGCANDARGIAEVLGHGSRHAPRVFVNDEATFADITDELRELPDRVPAGGTAVVFLSGHGGREGGRFYFLPYDYDPRTHPERRIFDSAILTPIRKLIETKNCWVVLIIDACHAGQILESCEPLLRNVRNPRDGGLIVLASSMGSETSRAGRVNSLFTGALLDGLRAQADLNGDRRVALSELKRYLAAEVRARLRQRTKLPGMSSAEQNILGEWSLSVSDSVVLSRVSDASAASGRWQAPAAPDEIPTSSSQTPRLLVGRWRMSDKTSLEHLELRLDADGQYVVVYRDPRGRTQETRGRYVLTSDRTLTLYYDNGHDCVRLESFTDAEMVLAMPGHAAQASQSGPSHGADSGGTHATSTYILHRVSLSPNQLSRAD